MLPKWFVLVFILLRQYFIRLMCCPIVFNYLYTNNNNTFVLKYNFCFFFTCIIINAVVPCMHKLETRRWSVFFDRLNENSEPISYTPIDYQKSTLT